MRISPWFNEVYADQNILPKGNFSGIDGRAVGLITKPMPTHAQKIVHRAHFFVHDAPFQVCSDRAIPTSGLK